MKDQQLNPELKSVIDMLMPEIDSAFSKENIPIWDRFMRAALFFVENCVDDHPFDTTEDLIKHEAFSKDIVPLFMQWYFEKYGELAKPPQQNIVAGIATAYPQPIKIKIPLSTSEPTDRGTAWLKFPDSIQECEEVRSFLDEHINIDILSEDESMKLEEEISYLVGATRTININLMQAEGLDAESKNMMSGIWSHFNKSTDDILTFRPERAAIGCWELHLAMEKSFKVLLKQKTGKKEFGHNLISLYEKAKPFVRDLDLELIKSLPSDKDAIQLRYAEKSIDIRNSISHYKTALKVVLDITSELDRKYNLNNAGFEIKQAPWAI